MSVQVIVTVFTSGEDFLAPAALVPPWMVASLHSVDGEVQNKGERVSFDNLN